MTGEVRRNGKTLVNLHFLHFAHRDAYHAFAAHDRKP